MDHTKIAEHTWMIDNPFHDQRGVLATYWLDTGETTLVIDPGAPIQIPQVLETINKPIDYTILTHIHLDHASGTWMINQKHPDQTTIVHPRGKPHLTDPTTLLEAAKRQFKEDMPDYGKIEKHPPDNIRTTRDNETLNLGALELKILWTPGHSSHSQCIHDARSGCLFVGDAAGHKIRDLVLPASPPPFNPEYALESIDKMIKTEPETICISHYGINRNPHEYLENYRERVRKWKNLSHLAAQRNKDITQLYKMIQREDPEIEKTINQHPETKHSIYSSLAGFLSYANWVNEVNPA
jgi:glyoxylase-like metal-dependent hydrolase (beta-lactamase superfamily II)